MANHPLSSTGEQAPEINKGHGTGALGPSDSSDSGSDVQGGAAGGRDDDDEFGLDPGLSEEETRRGGADESGLDLGISEEETRRGDADESGLDLGISEDETRGGDAGLDLGDAGLDSDTDSRGTGERSSAGREPRFRENNDVLPDHVETIGDQDDAAYAAIDDVPIAGVDGVSDVDGEVIEEIDAGVYEDDIAKEPPTDPKNRSER